MKREVLLVDLSSLFWLSYHATANESASSARELTLAAVRRAVGTCDGALVAVCLDQGRSFRKELAPDYKATREEKPAAALGELAKTKAQLERDGYWLVGADGFEADDVIATLCHAAVKAEHPVCIASADKDLLQLTALSDVRQLRTYNNWDTWRAANVIEKFGVEPEGLGDWLALVGDASDNIKGVPTVGPKTATELLVKHGGLDLLYAKVDELKVVQTGQTPEGVPIHQVETKTPEAKAVATPAVVDKLWRHKADAFLARKLVELRTDAPVRFEDIFTERHPVTSTNETTNMDDEREVADVISNPPKAAAPAGAAAGHASVPGASTPSAESASPPSSAVASSAPMVAAPTVAASSETALVVTYEHALEPRSPQGVLTLGQKLFESRAYSRFPTAEAIMATVMRGRELGIPALASLDAFHFVAELGRILPSWQLIRALAERDPKCMFFRWVGGDDKSATWETRHADHPEATRMTYTIGQAEKAGLLKPDKPKAAWSARPEEQLSKTCCCILARRVFSGAVLGLYSEAEMGGEDE